MIEPNQINVHYSEDDFVRGMKFALGHNRPSWFTRPIEILSPLVGYSIVYFWFIRAEGPWGGYDLLHLAVAIVVAIVVMPVLRNVNIWQDRGLAKIYHSSPIYSEPYVITFNDIGILSKSASFESEMHWSVVKEIAESDEDIHFFIAPRQSLFIPRRVFGKDQLKSVRDRAGADRSSTNELVSTP